MAVCYTDSSYANIRLELFVFFTNYIIAILESLFEHSSHGWIRAQWQVTAHQEEHKLEYEPITER